MIERKTEKLSHRTPDHTVKESDLVINGTYIYEQLIICYVNLECDYHSTSTIWELRKNGDEERNKFANIAFLIATNARDYELLLYISSLIGCM